MVTVTSERLRPGLPTFTARGRHPFVWACAGATALAVITAIIGAQSSLVDRPAVFVTLRTVLALGLVFIGLVVSARGSSRRLAQLLVAAAYAFAIIGLTAVDAPLPFTVGRLAIPVAIALTFYISCAYPSGRIDEGSIRFFYLLGAILLVVLGVADLLVSHTPAVAGPFVRCSGAACPASPLHVVTLADGASDALSVILGMAIAVMACAAAIVIGRRTLRASRLRRRSLTPMCIWNIVAALGYGAFVAVRSVDEHAALLTPSAVILAALLAAMPLAIAIGIARGRVLAVGALEHMVAELGRHPTLAELERTMSGAFADPTLRLLIWRPTLAGYVDSGGVTVDLSAAGPGRAVTRFDDDEGFGVAAAVHDPALADDPDVLEAAGTAVRLALDNARLQTDLSAYIRELEASRKRVAWAADEERRRIEQDLHDGAQQDLIGLRIKLDRLETLVEDDPAAVSRGIADAGRRIDLAIAHIRDLAKGIYPAVLRDLGLHAALTAVGRDLPIDVAVRGDTRRVEPEVETAVYFACLEALQNVVKHGGPDVRATVTLRAQRGWVRFTVGDDGPGFDPGVGAASRGLTSMRDRVAAIGGEMSISSAPGAGTTVTGTVPTQR